MATVVTPDARIHNGAFAPVFKPQPNARPQANGKGRRALYASEKVHHELVLWALHTEQTVRSLTDRAITELLDRERERVLREQAEQAKAAKPPKAKKGWLQ